MFSQIWTASRQGRFSRAIAYVCVVLWVAGSGSTLYGSVTPQWTTLHCPQSHSNSAHHTRGSCAWHCDGIETRSSSGRSWGPSITPTVFLSRHASSTICAEILTDGSPPGGRLTLFSQDSSKRWYEGTLPARKPAETNQEGCTHESD